MKGTKTFLFCLFLILALVMAVMAITYSADIPEALAGFDGLTNGSVDQATMDAASVQFQEQETPATNGIGPVYNDTSCLNCHQNQAVGGAAQVLELRAGHYEGGRPEWFKELRHRGDTNGSSGTFVAATAVLGNGAVIPNRSLINQRAICPEAETHLTDFDNVRATRLSLALFGDGYVEAVSDEALLALAASNGGQAIQVPVLETPGVTEVGRFGWKDQHTSLLSFASDAYVNEMGVTNPLNPDEATTVCQAPGQAQPNNDDDIESFATFMRALKAPPRGPITDEVKAGQKVFEATGCAHCHVETLHTLPVGTAIHGGAYLVPTGIGDVQFHPFGDYLLHDIDTGDRIVQNGPPNTANKVRTMPLWGLRTRTQLMHDAESATYLEAILRHGGEAGDERRRFAFLPVSQKRLLYLFLGSL